MGYGPSQVEMLPSYILLSLGHIPFQSANYKTMAFELIMVLLNHDFFPGKLSGVIYIVLFIFLYNLQNKGCLRGLVS